VEEVRKAAGFPTRGQVSESKKKAGMRLNDDLQSIYPSMVISFSAELVCGLFVYPYGRLNGKGGFWVA